MTNDLMNRDVVVIDSLLNLPDEDCDMGVCEAVDGSLVTYADLKRLVADLKDAMGALEHYADKNNWFDSDGIYHEIFDLYDDGIGKRSGYECAQQTIDKIKARGIYG